MSKINKDEIKLRFLKKSNSIYIKTDLFEHIEKNDYCLLYEKLKKLLSSSCADKVSSLDWRVIKYISERFTCIQFVYLAYHIDTSFLGASLKKVRYRQLFIRDCDTWSYECRWFAGYHPAKYNNSYQEAFLRCSNGNGLLHILNKKDSHLYSLKDSLEKNKKIHEINKTKNHLISPHEIKKILEREPENKLIENSKIIGLILRSAEFDSIESHADKLLYIKDRVEIETALLDEIKFRGEAERNILSEIYLLYRDVKNYFHSRCSELNAEPGDLDKKAFSFFDKNIELHIPELNSSKLYKDTVHKKSVAIICPGSNVNSIDYSSFDVAVFFNEVVKSAQGEKIIVNIAPTLTEKNFFSNDLSCIDHITSSLRQPSFFRSCDRVLVHPRKFLFNTCPAALQRFLYDIIAFSPSRIKIFGATLYLKKNGCLYKETYHQSIERLFKTKLKARKNQAHSAAFNVHDPLANFYFIKYLMAKNIIECDDFLFDVLKMQPYDYLLRLFNEEEHAQ